MSKVKENKNLGCIGIIILLSVLWGIPNLIRGKGFLNGIFENISAGVNLVIIGLFIFSLYLLYKIIKER